NNESEALRSWNNALDRIKHLKAYRMPSHYQPSTFNEQTLYDSLRHLELQCKERIGILEALRRSREDISPSVAISAPATTTTANVDGSSRARAGTAPNTPGPQTSGVLDSRQAQGAEGYYGSPAQRSRQNSAPSTAHNSFYSQPQQQTHLTTPCCSATTKSSCSAPTTSQTPFAYPSRNQILQQRKHGQHQATTPSHNPKAIVQQWQVRIGLTLRIRQSQQERSSGCFSSGWASLELDIS
ncbi:hypothetical protein KEM55_004819, partial [Ascosphaera atra]